MADPRRHRLVHHVDANRIIYRCGCVNAIDPESSALYSVSKCHEHQTQQRAPETLGRAYFEELSAIRDGIPQCSRYLGELEEALGKFSPRCFHELALEIGPGVSMYCPGILAAGYRYSAVEPSKWAAQCTSMMYDVPVTHGIFEEFVAKPGSFELILAAHSLEHMHDAPSAIDKCSQLLAKGGEFWIIVPDDSDPLNPDHLWTFNVETLTGCLERSGFKIDHYDILRRVSHENFIYVRAVKA